MVDHQGIARYVPHEPNHQQVARRRERKEDPPRGQPHGRRDEGAQEGQYTKKQSWQKR